MSRLAFAKTHHFLLAILASAAFVAPAYANGLGVSVGASVGGIDADVSADVGHSGASANVGVGGSGSGASANVDIGHTHSASGSSSRRATTVARSFDDNSRSGAIAADELVGLVVMSSDRQVLGIVQNARFDAGGYLLNIQVNSVIGINQPAIALKMPTVTPRNDRIQLGMPMARIRALYI